MDFRIAKQTVVFSKKTLDTEITQAVEHDFILPDYCPDIFRVLKCFVIPGVTSTSINGSRLSFDLSVTMRVLYRSSQGGIACVEHTHEYTKSVELPADCVEPNVTVTPFVQNVNCRAADKRRVDVRATAVCRVTVEGEGRTQLVSSASGGGTQVKKVSAVYPASRLICAKRITVIEELELAAGKPAFGSVLRCGTSVELSESKIIPGKLITKGSAEISLVYLPKGEAAAPESMRFSIPFSQIIDMEGLEDGFDTDISVEPARCIISPREENGLLECELILMVNICAERYESGELVADAYSTKCECELVESAAQLPCPVEKQRVAADAECTLSGGEGEIKRVYDMWTDGAAAAVTEGEQGTEVSGRVTFCLLGELSDGMPCYIEKECAFTAAVPSSENTAEAAFAKCVSCSYTLDEDGKVRAAAKLNVTVIRTSGGQCRFLSDIKLNSEQPKKSSGGCAVKICFSAIGESIWDIAKRYSTEPAAIEEQNPESASGKTRALIIPIKN